MRVYTGKDGSTRNQAELDEMSADERQWFFNGD